MFDLQQMKKILSGVLFCCLLLASVASVFAEDVPPPVLGDFESVPETVPDAKFYSALPEYVTHLQKTPTSTFTASQKIALIAREAWSLALLSRSSSATSMLRRSLSNSTDNNIKGYGYILLRKLLARILFESKKYREAQQVLDPLVHGPVYRVQDVRSYLACLSFTSPNQTNLQEQLSSFAYSQKNMGFVADPLLKICSDRNKVFNGVICRRSKQEILFSFEKIVVICQKEFGSALIRVPFNKTLWQKGISCDNLNRLSQVKSFLSSDLLGHSRFDLRKKLGMPCFCDNSTVFEDYFPVLVITTRIPHGAPQNKVQKLWCLVASYDQSDHIVNLELKAINHMSLRNGGFFYVQPERH